MKIVFMGTPDFARGALESLIEDGYEIVAVVTQPDKPKGRSGELVASPVKECALKYNIPVFQPRRIKTPEAVEELRGFGGDIFIVAAFGQILSQEILDMPKLGCINIHASLLPRLRGASPIQHAIVDGERETGITIMQMDAGVDTGDMLYKKSIPIADTDTFETLHDKLMALGGEAICEALPLIASGKLVPEKQDAALATHVGMIDKSEGELNFDKTAVELDRQVRGFNPWPGSFTYLNGKQLKVWKAVPVACDKDIENGTVVMVEKDSIAIKCGEGALLVTELQLEGKKRMSTHDFLLGVKINVNDKLGR